MDFDSVYFVFDALYSAFHQDRNIDVDGADDRFVALWTLFRISVGWEDEDEFFDILHEEHECPECAAEHAAEEKKMKTETKTSEKEGEPVVAVKTLPPNKLAN